jgi:hypothetical protein
MDEETFRNLERRAAEYDPGNQAYTLGMDRVMSFCIEESR